MRSLLLITTLLTLTSSTPLTRQIASTCTLDPTFYDGLSTPNYYIANWAQEVVEDAKQCSVVDTYDSTSISWHSTFSWEPSKFIRGNPNAGYSKFKQGDVYLHKSIPVSWEWE